MSMTRRSLLGGAAVLTVGCGNEPDAAGCAEPTEDGSGRYCLIEPLVVRVPGAATLADGEALLFNVDDDTAVIVARDGGGLHALSGICTHACCVVSLCGDTTCSSLTTTPDFCGPTRIAAADPQGRGILCPCHGSTFRIADGVPLSPPATTPLPAWSMRVDGEDVLVDTTHEVDASVRV